MSQRVHVHREVMVLGGAPEAGWVSQELCKLGYTVHWASVDGSPLEPSFAHPRLSLEDKCVLVGLEGHVGSFVGKFRRDGRTFSVSAAALVAATGNERFYPAKRYRLDLSDRVMTVPQVQRQLDAPRAAEAVSPYRDERVVVMLDLGGESSKETAAEALRLAMRLHKEQHSEVYVFYQNLKVDTYNLERLTRDMRDQGIVFCRYADPGITVGEQGIDLSYIEGTLSVDRLVLPQAVRPRGDTVALAALLNVRVGADGYFQDVNIHQYRPGLSSRNGIFFAGRCHMDADLPEIQADAVVAASNVDALLGAGYLEPEAILAHVDSHKCIRCLTCVRTCPHAAVEIATYDGAVAARVAELACRGCGACVANCPVRAIELVGQTVPAWMQVS